uniref:Reverse transcriptase domain-containing protein n=1 Tax=Amphimedon queenslandica TaxID=400682 RepID=A0A1X7SUE5_AMPQE
KLKCMFGCADNVVGCLRVSMTKWKCNLMCNKKELGSVFIRKGIFQGDSLLPLLFVLCMVPLSLVLRTVSAGYKIRDKNVRMNHLMFMDDLKLFGKNERQIHSLINRVQAVSEDIGMEFGIDNCGVLNFKRGKVVESDGMEMPNGDIMRSVEEYEYKYLGVLEFDQILEKQMKNKMRSEYFKRLKLILKSKLTGKNKVQALKTWAVAILRYSGGILDWRSEELNCFDRRTRKFWTIYWELYQKSDVDSLYLPRRKGGRGLIGCENSITAEINGIGW